jgi:8-oxo-dGTP pyrophosphatase MutT (NUDIX family)
VSNRIGEIGWKNGAKDLLLEDYRYISSEISRNEQIGETRVNWLIGTVTAVVGALILLTSADHGPSGELLGMIIAGALFALMVLGLITLARVLKRNESTDRCMRDHDLIRQIFKDYFDTEHVLLGYHPFWPQSLATTIRKPAKTKQGKPGRAFGGLAHIVLAINSLLSAALVGVVVYPVMTSLSLSSLVAFGAFVLTGAVQFSWVKRRERSSENAVYQGMPTHAGGIVYKVEQGVAKYLLIGPKTGIKDQWLFPKGHIRPEGKLKKQEGDGEAALREVREETGIVARLVCPVGENQYLRSNEVIRVKFYLMEAIFHGPSDESRRAEWFGFEQAHSLLSFDPDKLLLQEAEKKRMAIEASRHSP